MSKNNRERTGAFPWILINFMKTAFSSFIFDLFWLLSEKMPDSGRKWFNELLKKTTSFVSQSIIFQMQNFFCKHLWLICSWIMNRWIVYREIARTQPLFSGKFHWNKWNSLPPRCCGKWYPVSLVSTSLKL